MIAIFPDRILTVWNELFVASCLFFISRLNVSSFPVSSRRTSLLSSDIWSMYTRMWSSRFRANEGGVKIEEVAFFTALALPRCHADIQSAL